MAGAHGVHGDDHAAEGPPHPSFVALVGAPRSGTTWLQTLVGSHDAVASPQETNLFSRYVAPLEERWAWEARGSLADRQRRRFAGLGAVLTEDEFRCGVGAFVADVVQHIARLKPGASIVLEKTPSHSLHVELISRYVPGARFLHIVRDGRDVAASLVAASQSWGAAWGAPRSIGAAAHVWRDHVEGARRADGLAPYHEVRFETLRGPKGAEALRDVFAFCGVEVSEAEAGDRLGRYGIDAQRSGARGMVIGGEAARHERAEREPEGFFRAGRTGGWQGWTTRERVEFAAAAGRLLHDLGYADDEGWIGSRPAALRARAAVGTRRRLALAQRVVAGRLMRSAARIEP